MRLAAAKAVVLAAAVLVMSDPARAADVQLRPFIGVTFAGSTTLIDLANSTGQANVAVGIGADVIGEVFGAEIEVADAPGYFKSGPDALVPASHVTTVTGNVVVAAPRRWTQYSLRPYLVAGGGLMRIRKEDVLDVFTVSNVVPAIDFGVGAVGFLTNRFGIGWDVRRFQSIGSNTVDVSLTTTSDGRERLSFWRAQMMFAFRLGRLDRP
jgi:hypothetical protein